MAREIVTSENLKEYNEKKMAQQRGLKPMVSDEEIERKARAKKMDDEQYERVKKHPRFAELKAKLGKRGAMDAILKELNDAQ